MMFLKLKGCLAGNVTSVWMCGQCSAEGLSCKKTEHQCGYVVSVLLKDCHVEITASVWIYMGQ